MFFWGIVNTPPLYRTGEIRYSIFKNINSQTRLKRQRQFLDPARTPSLRATYFGAALNGQPDEPFALVHRSIEEVVP